MRLRDRIAYAPLSSFRIARRHRYEDYAIVPRSRVYFPSRPEFRIPTSVGSVSRRRAIVPSVIYSSARSRVSRHPCDRRRSAFRRAGTTFERLCFTKRARTRRHSIRSSRERVSFSILAASRSIEERTRGAVMTD